MVPADPFKDDPKVPAPLGAEPPAADPEAPPTPLDGPELGAKPGKPGVKPVSHAQVLNKFFLELRGGDKHSVQAAPRELSATQQQAQPETTSKLNWQVRKPSPAPAAAPATQKAAPAAPATTQPALPSSLIKFDRIR